MSPESLLRKAQALGDDIKEMESIDVLGAYYQAQTKIKTNRRKNMYNQLMRYAAFLTIPLFLSSLVLGYLYFSGTETDEKYAEVVTATGSVIRYELPDHSVVWLNAGSTLRYPTTFKKDNRLVELKGEACFEVAKDEKCPFIVSADGMDTHVLGTKFNVRSYTTEDRHVTLVQGKVQVTNTNSLSSVVLQPGQDLTYTETGEEKISNVNIATYTAWTEGMFYFEDASLEEIMGYLGRWYNVNIDFERVELYDIRLNFWANRNAHPEEAVELLNKLEKVRVDYQDGTITIKHI